MPEHLDGLEDTLACCAAEHSDDDEAVLEDLDPVEDDGWDGSAPLCDGEKQVVFTDGACSYNQDVRYRRAGIGIFWAKSDTRNIS